MAFERLERGRKLAGFFDGDVGPGTGKVRVLDIRHIGGADGRLEEK